MIREMNSTTTFVSSFPTRLNRGIPYISSRKPIFESPSMVPCSKKKKKKNTQYKAKSLDHPSLPTNILLQFDDDFCTQRYGTKEQVGRTSGRNDTFSWIKAKKSSSYRRKKRNFFDIVSMAALTNSISMLVFTSKRTSRTSTRESKDEARSRKRRTNNDTVGWID